MSIPLKINLKTTSFPFYKNLVYSYLNTIENILTDIQSCQKKQINVSVDLHIIDHNSLAEIVREYIMNNDLKPLTAPYFQSDGILLEDKDIFINRYKKSLAIHKLLRKKDKNVVIEVMTSYISLNYVLRDLIASTLVYALELMPLHASCITLSYTDKDFVLVTIGYSGFGKTTIGDILKSDNKFEICSDEFTFVSNKFIIPIPSIGVQCKRNVIEIREEKRRLVVSFIIPKIGKYQHDVLELYPLIWRGLWYFKNVFGLSHSDIINITKASYKVLLTILEPYINAKILRDYDIDYLK